MREQIISFLEESWVHDEPVSIVHSTQAFSFVSNVHNFNFSRGKEVVEIFGDDTYCCIRISEITDVEFKDEGVVMHLLYTNGSLEIRRVS